MKNVSLLARALTCASLPILSFVYQPLSHAAPHEHCMHEQTAMTNSVAAPLQPEKEATIKLNVEKISRQGEQRQVFVKLTDIKSNKPVKLADLAEVHTQKIHMLIIDDNLNDYSHVHPKATAEPGVYQFSWQPKKKEANYRIWADLVPLKTQQQEYAVADLFISKRTVTKLSPHESLETALDGYQFKLSFVPAQLKSGQSAMGKIIISDAKGKPVTHLEPIMGAYAHIVGFNEDFNSVVHIHPMGAEPKKASDRGGPELTFHIGPEKAGYTKLFAQVKINGKEIFAPFSLIVS